MISNPTINKTIPVVNKGGISKAVLTSNALRASTLPRSRVPGNFKCPAVPSVVSSAHQAQSITEELTLLGNLPQRSEEMPGRAFYAISRLHT